MMVNIEFQRFLKSKISTSSCPNSILEKHFKESIFKGDLLKVTTIFRILTRT